MAAKRTTGRAAAKPAAAAKQKIRTQDSFQNFIARVGQGTGNQHDGAHYGFNPITRNRIQMEFAYRGSWVVGRVVDCVARDMTRERIDINTDADSGDVKQFDKGLARMKMWSQLCLNIKWARLYGGSCAFMMIDGQDPKTPLRPDTIGKGQFKGLLPMDRWLLNPSLQELVSDYGPHFGKPKFYSTVPDSMGMPLMTIHHTRMVRLDGVELPYWQKISENLWGQSVLERMWDRLLAFDSTTTGVAQLVYKAHLRTLKIPDLRGIIGQGGQAMNGVLAQVNMIRAMQTNEGMTILDKEDEFDIHSYAFSGLDAVLVQFGEQLCGAVEIPAVRMFGQSPAGFNSGESDLRSYYDSIKQNQEADLGPELETVYKVAWLSEFGFAPPEEFDLEFEHLWQMDEVQKSQVTETTAKSITDAYEKQLLDRATGMRELKELGREVGTFSQITDESITEAEADPPPTPEALGLVAPPKPEPGAGAAGDKDDDESTTPEYKPDDAKPFKALDAAGVPQHKETGRFTYGMGLDEKRYDEKGKKDPEGEWADSPLTPVKSKSMREAIQAAHPHTCKAYGEQSEIEPWKLQGPQTRVNIKKVGGYRADHGDPITVVKRAGEHGIVDGHHRAVAAHLQGRAVAANIVDMDRAFNEAAEHEAANPGLGILGGLHLATQLRLKNTPTPKRTKDSAFRRLLRLLSVDEEFKESEHPRDDEGKFTEGGAAKPKQSLEEYYAEQDRFRAATKVEPDESFQDYQKRTRELVKQAGLEHLKHAGNEGGFAAEMAERAQYDGQLGSIAAKKKQRDKFEKDLGGEANAADHKLIEEAFWKFRAAVGIPNKRLSGKDLHKWTTKGTVPKGLLQADPDNQTINETRVQFYQNKGKVGVRPTVLKVGDKYELMDGHHRALAQARSGATDIKVEILDLSEYAGIKTTDALMRRLYRVLDIEWNEKDHPRKPDGKFGEGGADPYAWKKIGEKLGSNEGGTYEKNGAKYYVKFPTDPNQGRTEVLSAQLAESMGIKTTAPVNVTIDGKLAVVSEQQELQKISWGQSTESLVGSLTATQRAQLARIYYHAKLTKNWDVLGVDYSNIMMNTKGDLVLMDTGGSFEYRAQGKHKDYTGDPADTDLMDSSMPSGKVFLALHKKDPQVLDAVRKLVVDDIKLDEYMDVMFDNSQVKGATGLKLKYADRLKKLKPNSGYNAGLPAKPAPPAAAPPSVKSIEAAQLLSYHQQEQLVKDMSVMLERKKGEPGYKTSHQRLREAMRAARTLEGGFASQIVAKAIKCPPPPVTDEAVHAVSNYVDSSASLNNALRLNSGQLPSYSNESHKKDVAILDGMMKEARDFAIPIKMVRGMPTHYLDNMKVGDTYVDHGYMSTSFAETIGKELFGKKAAVLNITIPKGFKFLSVPSFSAAAKKVKGNHAGSLSISEAEAILPRGTGLRIKSISKVGDQRVVDVEAVFSSIQPARDEWKSTKAAKVPYQFHPHLKPKEPGAP